MIWKILAIAFTLLIPIVAYESYCLLSNPGGDINVAYVTRVVAISSSLLVALTAFFWWKVYKQAKQ